MYGWILKGEQKLVPTTARQPRLNFIGGICLNGHRIIYQQADNVDTGALPVFSSFLYDESAYTGQKLHQKFHYIESIAISTLHSH